MYVKTNDLAVYSKMHASRLLKKELLFKPSTALVIIRLEFSGSKKEKSVS